MRPYWICPGCGYEAQNEEQKQHHLILLPAWFAGSSMVPSVEHILVLRAIFEAF